MLLYRVGDFIMIKDEIKKANLVAMKNKDQVARGLYSVVLNKIMMEEVKRRTTGKGMTDGDVLAILQKTAKDKGIQWVFAKKI